MARDFVVVGDDPRVFDDGDGDASAARLAGAAHRIARVGAHLRQAALGVEFESPPGAGRSRGRRRLQRFCPVVRHDAPRMAGRRRVGVRRRCRAHGRVFRQRRQHRRRLRRRRQLRLRCRHVRSGMGGRHSCHGPEQAEADQGRPRWLHPAMPATGVVAISWRVTIEAAFVVRLSKCAPSFAAGIGQGEKCGISWRSSRRRAGSATAMPWSAVGARRPAVAVGSASWAWNAGMRVT